MSVTLIINGVVYILDDVGMLPTVSQSAAPAGAETLPAKTHMALRILFVEDNDYVRDLTLSLLENEGREVVACASAEEALDLFRSRPFDVVITDVSLPRMSGVELARRVLEVAPETWIVIASGYQLPTGLDHLGAHVRVMMKPFEHDQVNMLLGEIRVARR